MPDAASISGSCDFSNAEQLSVANVAGGKTASYFIKSGAGAMQYFSCAVGTNCQNGHHLTVTVGRREPE